MRLQELKSLADSPTVTFVFIAGLANAGQSDFAATLSRVLPKKSVVCSAKLERSILMSANITTSGRSADLYQKIGASARKVANSTYGGSMHRVVLLNACSPGSSGVMFPVSINSNSFGPSMLNHPNLLQLHAAFKAAGVELKIIFLRNSLRLDSMLAQPPSGPDRNGRVRVIADNLRILSYYLVDYPGAIACMDAGKPTAEAAHAVANIVGIPPLQEHGTELLRRLEAQALRRHASVAVSGKTASGPLPEWTQSAILGTWEILGRVCSGGQRQLKASEN